MGISKTGSQEVRKLIKLGRSICITLPRDEVRDLKWREGQKVIVERWGEGFKVKDWED